MGAVEAGSLRSKGLDDLDRGLHGLDLWQCSVCVPSELFQLFVECKEPELQASSSVLRSTLPRSAGPFSSAQLVAAFSC